MWLEWNKNKKPIDIDLFNIDFEDDEEYDNIILTIYSTEWVKALELGLEYFVEQEEYETCAQIRNLLIKIKNKKNSKNFMTARPRVLFGLIKHFSGIKRNNILKLCASSR